MRLLKYTSPMMYGEDVRELQSKLNSLGNSRYNCGAADGYFGQNTDKAVRNFQSDKRLEVDGIVGQNTWNALNSAVSGGGSTTGLKKFVDVARQEVGYKESSGNVTKYGNWFGFNDEWCAMFVSWCANEASILGNIVPKYALCSDGANWYKNRGKYKTRQSNYEPKAGDVIFFNRGGGINHTGIVEAYSASTVYTIEGNKSDAVRKGNYSLSDTYINGYGVN